MAPHAAVNEVNETILAFQDLKPEIADSDIPRLILDYAEKLRVALENLPSDDNHILLNHVISVCSSAHQDVLFDY